MAGLLGLFEALSFFLGLLVIPTWLLTVVTGQRRAAQEIDRTLPAWLRPDFWAVVRIFDRAFGAFIRGSCWWPSPSEASPTPDCRAWSGWAGRWATRWCWRWWRPCSSWCRSWGLWSAPCWGALVGFSASPGTGLAVLGTYYLVQRLVGAFVGSRVERRVSDLHPTILVLVIVALSQLGWQWIFWRRRCRRSPATCGATRSSAWAIPRRAGALPGAESTEAPEPARVCWRPARCAGLP